MEDFKTIKEELDSLYDSNRYLEAYIVYLEKMILNEKFSEEHEELRVKFYQIVETDDNYSHLRIKEEEE